MESKQLFQGAYSNEELPYLWRSYVSVSLILQIYFLLSIWRLPYVILADYLLPLEQDPQVYVCF